MSNQETSFAYHQFAALGASPLEQVVALYDQIIRDLHACMAATSAGHIEKRVNASNHALTIIGELQGVLDFEQGGEVARNLNNFYRVTRPMVTQASITSSTERFQELIGMYSRVRAAWAQVARNTPGSKASERADPSPLAENAPASGSSSNGRTRRKTSPRIAATPQNREDSSTSRWSA
jgi:flagellar secretion chaperone FliS